MDVVAVYVQALITAGSVIMGIWGFAKVIKDIKNTNDAEVKRRARWDNAAKTIEEKAQKWDVGLSDVYEERNKIVERYDERLNEQDAKIQQLYAMMCMSLKAQDAILEALANDDIGNGDIKDMKKRLSDFIADQIGQ